MQAPTRQRRIWALLLLVLAGYLAWAILRPLPALTAVTQLRQPRAKTVALNWPSKAQATVGAAGYGILANHGSQKPAPMASTAKLAAAMAIIKSRPLVSQSQPMITFSASDVAIYKKYLARGGSVVPVKAGEQMSEYQALQAMLIPSANNIADSLAIWAFGSMNNFLSYTNQYLKSLGLGHTVLADASGFSPKSVSTANDLTRLGLAALDQLTITKIAASKQATLPIVGTVHNVNWLLGVDGINGLKTGNTDQAGGCFLFSAKKIIGGQSLTLVGAVMGAHDLTAAMAQSRQLLASEAAGFHLQTIATAGQSVGFYSSSWGGSSMVVAAGKLTTLGWDGQPLPVRTAIDSKRPPIKTGQEVGSLSVTANGQTTSRQLIAARPIAKPSLTWRLLHPLP